MILTLILLSLLAASEAGRNTRWWKHANIYEVYLKSFKDSDGDGIGDIRGLTSKLDYFVHIGVDTIYLPPFYPSSNIDGGYDIVNYTAIDPVYGTMEDFERLINGTKTRGLYLVIDLVINHSSDEHVWFQKSINKTDPYTDYYVWADAKGYDSDNKPIKPNNWVSLFNMTVGGSAWTWNEKRAQFYLHQCQVKQPDLNQRNEFVKKEIKDLMTFWLNQGVTAFRVDAPMIFMEDKQLRDLEMRADRTVFDIFQDSGPTYNHPDTYKFVNELNMFLKQYDRRTRKPVESIMIGETYGSIKTVMSYYGTKSFPVFHLPFNFLLTMLDKYLDARGMQEYLNKWLKNLPEGMPSNWALGNHDIGRTSLKFDPEYNSILLALVTMLPGTSTIYFGEELSMGENHLGDVPDIYNRFFHRTPMQWDDTRNAGFTSGEKPWLPVHPNYWYFNVQAQKANGNSSLNYFKNLMTIRKTDTVKYGNLQFYNLSKWVLALLRTYKENSYMVVMNLGTDTHPVDLQVLADDLPVTLTVVASSPNSGYVKGLQFTTIPNYPSLSVLRPHSALILSAEKLK